MDNTAAPNDPQEEPPMEEPPSPLLGRVAPPVALELAAGGKMDLRDHVGKDIVVLDFWATWCPPCRRELPVLIQVIDAYRERGVVLYAVNQGEEPDTVREFLESSKLKFTAALDSAGETGTNYGVEGIPMLVVIDKQGIVQAVHVGFSPELKEELSRQLDALLDGQSLVARHPASQG